MRHEKSKNNSLRKLEWRGEGVHSYAHRPTFRRCELRKSSVPQKFLIIHKPSRENTQKFWFMFQSRHFLKTLSYLSPPTAGSVTQHTRPNMLMSPLKLKLIEFCSLDKLMSVALLVRKYNFPIRCNLMARLPVPYTNKSLQKWTINRSNSM